MSFDANNTSWYNIMLDEGNKRAAENNDLLKHNNNIIKKQRDNETQNFDELLEDVDYNIFYQNLLKLLQFMESNQQELCFPVISKKNEEIFKAIVLDVTVLNSHKLNESYKDVCNKIINVFNVNKDFFISCTRELKDENNDVLIFKKVYNEASSMKKTESSTASISSSMESLNMQSSCPQSSFEHSYLYGNPNVLTKDFKKLSLTVILDFVKYTSKYFLTFHNLTKKQAEFIEAIVKYVTNGHKYVYKFGDKPLYTALWEAVKIFRPKFEIITESSTKTLLDNTLLVKKVVIYSNGLVKDLKKKITKENSMERTIVQSISSNKIPKTQKQALKISKVIQFVDALSPVFVNNTLIQVIEFIQDEQRASLILIPTNAEEQQFYRMIFSMITSYKNYGFKYNYRPLLERIAGLIKRYPCRMPKERSNPSKKKGGLNQVSIVKKTTFLNTSLASSTKQGNTLKKKFLESMSAPPSPSSNMCIKKAKLAESSPALRTTEADDAKAMPPPPPQSFYSKKQMTKLKQEMRNFEKKSAKSTTLLKSGISFKPASEEVAKDKTDSIKEQTTVLGVKNEWPEALTAPKHKVEEAIRKMQAKQDYELRTRRGKQLEQNAQLMKALSVPVQSDKAMKMMRVMGWSGGALGARGEGITEPIMPTLELMAGAGLGHGSQQKAIAKPPQSGNQTPEPQTQNDEINQETDIIVAKTNQLLKNQSFNIDHYQINEISKKTKDNQTYIMDNIYHDPANFQLDILTGVLELLSTDSLTKTIRYKSRINKKYRKFIKSIFRALANRNKPGMPLGEHLHSIVRTILMLYREMPDVLVSAYLPDSLTEVVLTKTTSQDYQVKELIKMQKQKQDTDDWIIKISKEDLMSFLDGLAPPCHGKRTFKSMKFRVLIIMKILFFVVSDDEEIIFEFDKALPCKQKAFVEVELNSFYTKAKYGSTQFELALAVEIKKRIGDYTMDLKFGNNDRIMTITKNWRMKTPADISVPIKSSSFFINLENFIDPFEVPKSKRGKGNKESSRVNQNIPESNTGDVGNRELNEAIDYVTKDSQNDESSDYDDEISCASDDNSQITLNSYNTDYDKTLNSITSDKNSLINNTLNCDEDAIENKNICIETNVSQTTVEENKHKSTITDIIDTTNKEVVNVVSPSGTENIDSIEDCNIDLDTDLVDYESSEDLESIQDENPIDLTGDEINAENGFDSNIDKGFEVDTNCDKVLNVDVSDKNCDIRQNSDVKMVSNESQTEPNNLLCSEISNVYIVPVNYPQDNLTDKRAIEIQKLISHAILKSNDLPLLMCHGVQNGALIYSCYNKNTLLWLQSTLSAATHLKVIDVKNVTKMALKFHCLFDFNIQYLFRMIERYNPEISTFKWVIEKSEIHDNYALFLVQMDEKSVNFIHASGLALFAGVDKVEFSLIF